MDYVQLYVAPVTLGPDAPPLRLGHVGHPLACRPEGADAGTGCADRGICSPASSEAVGEVREVRQDPSSLSLVLETTLAAELHPGDSVAVNGVCLTVVRVTADNVYVDVGPETARVTTLATARPGQPVNLERAMRADGRFGGHIVQGHIDGTGVVDRIRDDGDAHWLTISLDGELARRLILKARLPWTESA